MYTSFEYVYKNRGVDKSSVYPYKARVSEITMADVIMMTSNSI